ncbi:hypothetical protein [Pendulispora albinea]|uniref:DUF3040 domain-containing protein n=1 Tax=Pendulispora albinea TaxID=2741071 RepID=A0ABZ2M910_9BACT
MAPPYRNEVESLRAENERLRAELGAQRPRRPRWRRPWVTALLIALELIALFALQPWLNAPSDVRFWGAVAILVALGIAAALSAFGHGRRAD